jgi:hypothetical protein
MACHTDLVSLSVSEIRSVVVMVILGPQSRRPFGTSTLCEGNRIGLVYDFTAIREKRRHLSVSCVMRVPIEGFADQEQRPRVQRLPTCPRSTAFAEAFADPKHRHQFPVESQSPIEILHAYNNVGEHASYAPQFSAARRPGIRIAFPNASHTSIGQSARTSQSPESCSDQAECDFMAPCGLSSAEHERFLRSGLP